MKRPTRAVHQARFAAAIFALAAALAAVAGAADAPAQQAPVTPSITIRSEWPGYMGPNGNFSESSGARLLDDMTKARLVWESEEKGIGFGKAHTAAGKTGVGAQFQGLPPGGEASPIVAGGLVVMSYFVPRGDVWDAEVEKRMGRAFEKHVWLVAADDVVIGIDAATGNTRWKQVFADKGINTGAGKRGGWAATPCASDGKIFALGTTGRVYALDLAKGKPLWESDIGPVHKRLEEAKAKGMAARRLALEGSNFRPYGILSVVDDVLLVTDWAGGLLGFDPAGGKTLWHAGGKERILSDFNTPCPARVGGKTYVACANARGDLRLIDPKSGKVLWTVALKCEHLTQPIAGNEHLLVFESNPAFQEAKQEGINQVGVLAAYRFDEKGAKRDWALPAEYAHELKLDAGPSRRVIPRDGLVYYLARSKREGGAACRMVIIREKDGTILKSQDVDANQFYLWGDRVVTVSDLQHRPRPANPEIWQLYTADPADFRRLGEGWHVNNPQKPVHTATGGYEVPVYEAFADGLMFARVMGGIRCYDLRR
ncbi:MAG: PQQ-like beta-propeller repeat protein [Planctomycetes bacterium]|nr:PQQ-like beta-propeller repeat protein [Planctomycetota bacterium]